MAHVLVVGKRRQCYRAALELGHQTFLWADGAIHESRKKKLSGWIESPFGESSDEISKDVSEKIKEFKLDFVVAATESSVDLAAKIRRDFSLPGTPISVSNLLHDKHEMKKMARTFKIPITNFHLIESGDTADSLIEKLGLPLVIKPVAESGARGVHVLKDKSLVKKHLQPGLLAESYVDGREVSVETLIYQGRPIFHNITDYLHQWKKSILPAQLPDGLKSNILEINDKVISSFGVESGMTHSEFYLTKEGPVFGEMAVRPPGGYYMELIEEAYGFNPWKAYVQLECGGEMPEVIQNANKYASVFMIHPDEGRVVKISGVDGVKKISEIFEFKFKLEEGDRVDKHFSTSNECGHVLMSSERSDVLLDRILFMEQAIHIEIASQN